jgi:hypothetical protein
MAIVGGGKTRIQGIYDNGEPADILSTAEGHLEVAVHGPRLPFGSVDVATLDPIVQQDAVYGLPEPEIIKTESGGTVTASNNLFNIATSGGTIGNLASMQSRGRLRYRPGQGVLARYTALFTAGIANSVQVAGIGTGESGYYFGYNGTSFGILWNTGGVREIQTLTISSAERTLSADMTITLAGVPFTFSTGGSIGSPTTDTAFKISQQSFTGWSVESRDSTVIFVADSTGDKTGTFSLSTTGNGAGTFAQTLAGVSGTDTWIPQASWNGDKLDGTGASGVTLDPTKGNIYQIDVQYLGFGVVAFKVEVGQNGNNADWVTVHTINNPNTRTAVNVTQPSFPLTFAVYNSGTASGAVSLKSGSYAGFICGNKRLTGPRQSFVDSVTSSTSAYVPVLSFRNSYVYGGRANQSVCYLLSVSGAAKSNSGITTFYIIRGGTLTGAVYSKHSDYSVAYVDKTATDVTFTDDKVVWSGTVSETGQFTFSFDDRIDIQPGEVITLAVRSVTQAAVCVGQLNIREDQ